MMDMIDFEKDIAFDTTVKPIPFCMSGDDFEAYGIEFELLTNEKLQELAEDAFEEFPENDYSFYQYRLHYNEEDGVGIYFIPDGEEENGMCCFYPFLTYEEMDLKVKQTFGKSVSDFVEWVKKELGQEETMTKEELTQIRESLDLTKKEFAEKIGTTAMMVGRYEKGSSTIPEEIAAAAKTLIEPVVPSEEDVSTLIKQIRESLSLSKSALAKLIGVSGTAIGNYESGKSKPKDEIIEKIKSLMNNAVPVVEDVAVAPVDEKEEVAAPVDEIKEDTAAPSSPVNEKKEAASAEEKAEEPAPKKKKSAPAKKKEKSAAPVDEKDAATAEEIMPAPIEEKKSSAPSVVIESKMGGSITTEEVLSRLPDGVDTVYIKPEENAAYWVKGSESGVVNLW